MPDDMQHYVETKLPFLAKIIASCQNVSEQAA